MILRREEAIKRIRVWWDSVIQYRTPFLKGKFDSFDLAQTILGDVRLAMVNTASVVIQDFFEEAKNMTIDMSRPADAELLYNALVENVPGISSDRTDLPAIAAVDPGAAMALARG